PPRLSYSAFCTGSQRTEFLDTFTRAEQFVAQGDPSRLMEVRVPLPFIITAAGYIEKYGPDERYNFLNFLAGVRCPRLITLGGKELQNNVAFQGLPLELEQLSSARPHAHVISGADHFYTGRRTELVSAVERWLRGALSSGTTS